MKYALIIVFLVFLSCGTIPVKAQDDHTVALGVLAKSGVESCMEKWQPTADYLTSRMDGNIRFRIVPLPYDKIYDAVKTGSVDFILANPSFYVELERWYGVNRIATLKNRCVNGPCKTYGGVIFRSRHRTDIDSWEDLKGKRFMAANEFSLGGWRSVLREFMAQGINPYTDFSQIQFGHTHEDVVSAVLKNEVDAGSVRTGILEQMAVEGKLRLSDIVVIPRVPGEIGDGESLPFLCSTRLYPEWPMAKLSTTPDDLAEKVTIALLQMAPDSPEAVAAQLSGWTIPLNYQPVHECLRALKVGPYEDLGKITVRDVLHRYWRWITMLLFACIGSVILIIVILRLNKGLRESHRRLKEEMEERGKMDEALQHAKNAAEDATRAKSEFLANMSHEIRTPMNGVIAAAELVMNEPLPPKVKRYVKIIHTSAHSLLGLINDILDFSKIEAGKMSIEEKPFMLDEVIDRVVNLFFNNASEKGIELLVDIHPETVRTLVGDPLRLQQILTNLVGNSVKFTEEGGFILIGVKMTHTTDDGVVLQFQVQDTGVGIPQAYMDRLFQPFTQADGSDTRRYEGTGLGLSICRRLVEMMDGRIWVKSTVGQGSTFFFTVHVKRQAVDVVRKFDLPREIRRFRVLVVDDCKESLTLVSRMLTSFDFDAVTADSGEKAIETVRDSAGSETPISLAIIDWRMPEMDGFETVRRIRSAVSTDIPVIMMTAFGKDAERELAEQIGICCFLTKPIYSSTLYNAIMDVFGRKGETPRLVQEPIGTDITVFKRRLRGFRILVVEDNPTNSEIAVAILESAGMKADTAENGRVALERVQTNDYDAVLMDVQMPEMNGYEATRQIRSDPRMRTLPIIAMTAHAMRGDEEKCIQAGMDGYISKPVRQVRLFQLLWRLLKNRRPALSFAEDSSETVPDRPTDEMVLPDHARGLEIRASLSANQLDPAIYLKIAQGFGKNNEDMGGRITSALEEGDKDKAAALVHSLKGSAANIGAVDVQAAAEELARGLEGEVIGDETIQMGAHLVSRLNTVLATISNLPKGPGPGVGGKETRPQRRKPVPRELLGRLADALERSDPRTSRDVLKEITQGDFGDRFTSIEQLIDNYDYEEARALVEKMIQSGF